MRNLGSPLKPGESYRTTGRTEVRQMYWYWRQTAPALGAGETMMMVGGGVVVVYLFCRSQSWCEEPLVCWQVTDLFCMVVVGPKHLPAHWNRSPDQHHLREKELGHCSPSERTGQFIFYGWRMTDRETGKVLGFLGNIEKCRLVRCGARAGGERGKGVDFGVDH